jgi:hypothetical protein
METELMPEPETTYRSYLLRIWRVQEPGAAWRAMLENVSVPGERHYFKDAETLMAFLLKEEDDPSQNAEGGNDI